MTRPGRPPSRAKCIDIAGLPIRPQGVAIPVQLPVRLGADCRESWALGV